MITKEKIKKVSTAICISSFFTPILGYAAPAIKLAPPVAGLGGTLKDFIDLLIQIIQAVGIPVLVVSIIYAGYMLVTAGDNETQVTKAKTWIVWTIVGAAIILGAQPLTDLIFNTAALF